MVLQSDSGVSMPNQEDRDSNLRIEIAALRQRVEELEAKSIESERTRQLLQEEHSFRKVVISRAAEGICVCHVIPDYPFVEFTLWNPRMTEITGYSMEEINRLGWYQSMYPDPEIQERARQRMTKMRDGEDLRYERWEITRADGEKRALGISTSILTSHDGQIHVLALMQDVTHEERYRRQLESRLATLEGLLPICSSCMKIRNDKGDWQQLKEYISNNTEAEFTHGICPECAQELYPDLVK